MAGYKWSQINIDKGLIGYHKLPSIRESANHIFNLIKNLKLTQVNNFINYANNTLYLVLLNYSSNINVNESIDPLSKIDEAHSAHNIQLKITQMPYKKKSNLIYDYKAGNYKNISKELMCFNWSEFYENTNDVNKLLEKIYEILLSM